jgi:hypothetical protein
MFIQGWEKYAKIRNLPMKRDENKEPIFPVNYGVK